MLRAVLILFACFDRGLCIPLRDFFPFGIDQQDLSLHRTDDGSSPAINLSITFPYFDKNYRVVYVNNNGAISFTRAISQYTPDPFPLNTTQDVIAVYWGDVDTGPEDGGTVWYRESSNSLLLSRFKDEIQAAFPNQRVFTPTSLFIVTWDHVGYYSGKTDKTNTFQCVLGTDERRSYVIFLYADGEIQWTTGDASGGEGGFGGTPALAGFNAGDRIRFFNVPGSRTSEIINIASTSNVNKPGVWIFRIDDERIVTAGCSMEASGETLLLAPRLGNVLGGTPIQLSGPCFEENDNITCYFGDIPIKGTYLDRNRVLCVSPELSEIGRITLQLRVIRANELIFDGQVTFHSMFFEQLSEANIITDTPMLKSGIDILLEWDPDIFLAAVNDDQSVTVDIDLFKFDKNMMKWIFYVQLKSNVPNTGNANISIPLSITRVAPDLVVIRVTLNEEVLVQHPYLKNIAEWTNLAYTEGNENQKNKACLSWAIREGNIGPDLSDRLPPCPPTVQAAILDTLYVEDFQINHYRNFFHPNADRCFRQATFTVDNQGSGQECCYLSDGTLTTGSPGGGSVDKIAPTGRDENLLHQLDDLLPYIYCCKSEFSNCVMYYEKRPSDNGQNYEVIPPACVYGDPHIVTLDGYKYTFNGKGEFTLIETPDDRFTLQARMVEATGDSGDPVQATVFSALVGKQNDSDAVQLELSRRGIDARVNGMRVDFEGVVQQSFNNVTLFDVGNRTIEAIFSSGVFISAKEENGIISVLLVSLSNSYVGSTNGLMGIFNGDTSDDLIPKGSSEPIPLNSSLETIHNSFGITWIINNSTNSLFDYHQAGESWSTYYDPDFTPLFGAEFSDPEAESEAMELCKGDEFCLYDFATTGSMEIGLSTLNGSVNYEEMVETAKPIVCNPSCVNGACIANDTCQCAIGYIGQICTEPVFIECDVNPCENNGTCQSLAGSYICNCSRGFSGLFCEQNVTFRFEKDHYTVNEEGGRVELCILQNGESITELSIFAAPQEFTAEGAIDYVPSPVPVQFGQTDKKRCFHITIIDDFNRESTETFEVALLPNAGVTIVDPSLATVSIIDDDTNRTYDFVEETLYTVPLHIDQELVEMHPELSRATLCYSIDGRANRYFNMVSDKCVSVNAYYVSAQRANFFNVISKMGITAVDSDDNIQTIEIDRENCSATVGTTPVTSDAIYHSANITVRRRRNGYRIAVPNCKPRHLVLWVTCRSTQDADLLKFVIARGRNLMPTSHGLVGQFWNVPVDISPYDGPTPDDSPYYLVTVTPPSGKQRQFVGNLYPQTWDLSQMPCLYAGSSQGGTLGEFGDANDPVIEGHYSEYMVTNLFDTQFKYSQFEN